MRILKLLTALLITTASLTAPALTAPAQASSSCQHFTTNSPITYLTGYHGIYYTLTDNGGVYTSCAPFYGSAAGQGYFAGRHAAVLALYIVRDQVKGYLIISTSNQYYYYGDYTGGYFMYSGCSHPGFWVDSEVRHVTDMGGAYYVLSAYGGVYAPCGPFFGSASGQPYFTGHGADYLTMHSVNNNIVGYKITDTWGNNFFYGNSHIEGRWAVNDGWGTP